MTQPANHLTPLNFNSIPIVTQDVPLLKMPSDIVVRFLRHLTPKEIGESALICRQWSKILEQDPVWSGLFYHHFPSISPNIVKNFENFQNAYKTLCSNLTKGTYASYTLQKGKAAEAFAENPFAVADGKLFWGFDNETIKIWDIHTGKCTATLQRPENWLDFLGVVDGKLFSILDNSAVEIWDIHTGERISILQGDGTSIDVADGNLFSDFKDGTIKIWDIHTAKCIATLQGHGEKVDSFAVADGKLFSSFNNGTIEIWDIHTGECTATLQGHGAEVLSLVVADGELFSSFWDGTIKMWDIHTGEYTATLQESGNGMTSLIAAEGKLFSHSGATIKIWDVHTAKCTRTLQEHRSRVASLAVADGKLFSRLSNGAIKMWDILTGECIAVLQEHDGNGLYSSDSLVVADGKIFAGFNDHIIKVWDFTANRSTIFQEIAELLERDTPKATRQALERFSKMPNTAKNAIYGKLYKILKPFANDSAEHASYNQYWQQATPFQQAWAIKDYVSEITIT